MGGARVTTGIALAVLAALILSLAPLAAANGEHEHEPAEGDSGTALTLQVGPVFAPGDLIEIHVWVTHNGSLVATTWLAGWAHAHPPNLGEDLGGGETQGLIMIDAPVLWGHNGAYRATLTAPDVPGLYAIHGTATAEGSTALAFAHFQVIDSITASFAPLNMFWSVAAFAVAIITLAIVLVIAFRRS